LGGLVIGLAIGLYYSWVINPVEYVDTAPTSLREDFKSDYMALIAAAYDATGDLVRAQARLALFLDPNPAITLSQIAQQRLAAGRPQSETRALAQLAADLGGRPTSMPATSVGSILTTASPTEPTRTPRVTPKPPPTRMPTATSIASLEFVEQEKVCDPDLQEPLIQVEVTDLNGRPVPGVEVLVIWDTGQDHFFTGLKPELGAGYGDFTMIEGVTYTVQLKLSERPITGLIIEDCTEQGVVFPGSWLLTFQQSKLP
jgi:hypothetical protein